jgi:ketosteroid isomerase-like protein
METDIAKIKALTREFVVGFNSGDVDRIMNFYADAYVDVNLPNPIQTKAERADYYRKIITSGHVKVDVAPDEVIISGDHAFARGSIFLYDTRPGTERPKKELRYVEVWRKFASGWKSIWGIDADVHD